MNPLGWRRRPLLMASLGWPLAAAAAVPELPLGGLLPDTPLQGLNGRSRRLADYRGRPLLINVWASWCGPCRAEMASLERLAWSERARRFALIGISTDDDTGAALAWLERSRATLSHFIDRQQALEQLLGAQRIPLTVLVDAQGRLRRRITGAMAWDGPEALRLIDEAFAAAPR